jgi:hypothetical protein
MRGLFSTAPDESRLSLHRKIAMVHPVSAIVSPCPAKTFGFLVLPNFTTIGLASAVETLRMANLAARRPPPPLPHRIARCQRSAGDGQ